MPNLTSLNHLLQNTKRIVDHHEKITDAKGEHFNLFSVLDIETRENKTHSAFLSELLDPNGTHRQGSAFLDLFLKVVNKELSEAQQSEKSLIENFSSQSTTITPECHIGSICHKTKKGGRIDILLQKGTHTLCIENKIHAQDQKTQIQRYCNYNNTKNTVFYLTLKGEDPHKNSKGELESGEHFFNISYRDHIVQWLELCLKEVPNLTSVREAINQYILLIKKLTHQLNMEQKKELETLMASHLEESRFIADNFENMISRYKEEFRTDVEDRLKTELPSYYEVKQERNISAKYSKITIKHKDWAGSDLFFGLEPFSGSGNGNGHMFIGLLDRKAREKLAGIPEEKRVNKWWKQTRPIETKAGNEIKLRDLFSLEKITNRESADYKELVDLVVDQSLIFIKEYEGKVSSFIDKEKKLKLQIAD
ncbi:PD-(D/E)XK nuclease family protein [Salinimicrobium catena]|uniref:PDDEXK-like family protein n=1 Tax=Salinimicrobium catena TaxID=390640 RepID=UPI002FE4ACA1